MLTHKQANGLIMPIFNVLLLACSLLASHAHATVEQKPIYTSRPLTRTVTALTGIPEQHLTPRNFVLNHLPSLLQMIPTSSPKMASSAAALSNLLQLFTPIIKQAPEGYLPILRPKILAEVLINSLLPGLYSFNTLDTKSLNRRRERPSNTAEHYKKRKHTLYPFLTFATPLQYVWQMHTRAKLIKKISEQKIACCSRGIPKNMRGKEYMMLQSPLAYLLKRILVATPMAISSSLRLVSFLAVKHKKTLSNFNRGSINFFRKIRGADKTSPLLQHIEKMLQATPILPHIYILKSDYDKLPLCDRKAICDAMFIDIHSLEFNMVGHKAMKSIFT